MINTSSQFFSISIDGYDLGIHNITIWARGLDGKETETITTFLVYKNVKDGADTSSSNYSTVITISGILISILICVPSIVIIISSHKDFKKVWHNFKTNHLKPLKKTESVSENKYT